MVNPKNGTLHSRQGKPFNLICKSHKNITIETILTPTVANTKPGAPQNLTKIKSNNPFKKILKILTLNGVSPSPNP